MYVRLLEHFDLYSCIDQKLYPIKTNKAMKYKLKVQN